MIAKPRLLKNEADVSLAARSCHSVCLTCDNNGPLKRAKNNGMKVINPKECKKGTKLAEFIKFELGIFNCKNTISEL